MESTRYNALPLHRWPYQGDQGINIFTEISPSPICVRHHVPFFSLQMVDESWTTSYCLNTPGFPELLYATMTRLGILDHPKYVGKEYEEYGTERCEVIVYV